MDEHQILSQISDLVEQEHALRSAHQRGELTGDDERARLSALEGALDQCWDLLRQRRALRDSGGDPREAEVRPPDEVEGYLS